MKFQINTQLYEGYQGDRWQNMLFYSVFIRVLRVYVVKNTNHGGTENTDFHRAYYNFSLG